jgi:hypothetical protein
MQHETGHKHHLMLLIVLGLPSLWPQRLCRPKMDMLRQAAHDLGVLIAAHVHSVHRHSVLVREQLLAW